MSGALGEKFTEVFTFFVSSPDLFNRFELICKTNRPQLITLFNWPSAAQLPTDLKRLRCFLSLKYLDTNQPGFFFVIWPDDFPPTWYPWQPENVSDYEEAHVSSSHPCITSALDLNQTSGRENFQYFDIHVIPSLTDDSRKWR